MREQLEAQLAPLLFSEGSSMNRYWGFMARAGFADKSHLMRQIEKYADIYADRACRISFSTRRARISAGIGGCWRMSPTSPPPGQAPERGGRMADVLRAFVLLGAGRNRNSQRRGGPSDGKEPRIAIAFKARTSKRRTERAEPRIAGSHPALPPPQALGNLGEDGASGRGSATALADKAAHDCAEEQREEGALQRPTLNGMPKSNSGQLQQRSIRVDSMGSRAGREDCMHEG